MGSRDKEKKSGTHETLTDGLPKQTAVGSWSAVSAGIPLKKNKNYYFLAGLKKRTAGGSQSVGSGFVVAAESAKKHTFFFRPVALIYF